MVLHGPTMRHGPSSTVIEVSRALIHFAMAADGQRESINAASGDRTRVRELAELALEYLGGEAVLRFTGEALSGKSTHWRAHVGRLVRLGFSPRVPREARVAAYASWSRRETR
jgi:nucleoside-diphosphate-sugar epimerase